MATSNTNSQKEKKSPAKVVQVKQENMDDWNPMQEDFNNPKFNQYSSGIGANLKPGHQIPGTKKYKSKNLPCIIFKNLPKDCSVRALQNMCANHGKVVNVFKKNNDFFVTLPTPADLNAVFHGMEKNGYNMIIGGEKAEEFRMKTETEDQIKNAIYPKNMPVKHVDARSRDILISEIKYPRPQQNREPFVTATDYEKHPLLKKNDSKQHFLISSDSHELERAQLVKNHTSDVSQRRYYTGRSYKENSAFITAQIEKENWRKDEEIKHTIYAADNEIRTQKFGNCARCHFICNTHCDRCGEFYCSYDCQVTDWQKHRLECGKPGQTMPTPIAVDEERTIFVAPILTSVLTMNSKQLLAKLQDEDSCSFEAILPPTLTVVNLTAVSKSNLVFLHAKTMTDNTSYYQIVMAIQIEGRRLPKLKSVPTCGQIVVVHSEKQEYSRAMVLNLDDLNKIKIIYIDYGNVDYKMFDELLEAPAHYSQLPRYAVPVILKNVPDVHMTEEYKKLLFLYLNNVDLKLHYDAEKDFIKEKNVHQVRLYDIALQHYLNTLLLKLLNPVEPKSIVEDLTIEYLSARPLPTGINKKLYVMDNSLLHSRCVSCTCPEFALEILDFQKDIQRYAEKLPAQSYAPIINGLCIAKYDLDGKWYRGRCLELVGDGYPSILFIDFGNIVPVAVEDIRRYPAQFTFPLYTFDCEIEGLPEFPDEKLVEKLQEHLRVGEVISCDEVVSTETHDFYVLRLESVESLLQEKK